MKDKLKSMTGSSNLAAVRFILGEDAGKITFVSGKDWRKGQTQREWEPDEKGASGAVEKVRRNAFHHGPGA